MFKIYFKSNIASYCHTVPSAVKYLNYSRDSESITVTWPPAQNKFDGYVLSIKSKIFNKENMLSSGVRYEDYILMFSYLKNN